MNFLICISLSPIFFNCSSVALKICRRVEKFSKSCCVATGPMLGNPSRINCFCSSIVFSVLVCRSAFCIFGFSYLLATRIKKFAVSSSSSVKIVGTWKSIAIERSIPRIAFSWTLNLL